jgi:hypothetical protein
MLQRVDRPALETARYHVFIHIVTHSGAGQASPEQHSPAWPDNPPGLGSIIGSFVAAQIVETSPVEQKVESASLKRQVQHVAPDEGQPGVFLAGAAQGRL